MKKRKQHYVWKHYLSAWAENGMIWCCRNDKIFNSNLTGVGQERDFYQLKPLSEKDLDSVVTRLTIR